MSTPSFDWLVWTDGSGHHADGLWVSASMYVKAEGGHMPGTTLSCGSNGSVNRAELNALVDGLAAILKAERRIRGSPEWLPKMPLRVQWFADRENLVNGMKRDRFSGNPLNKRKCDADLWNAIAWYETVFSIEAVHIPRNSMVQQANCDRLCGRTRKVLKTWVSRMRRHKLMF